MPIHPFPYHIKPASDTSPPVVTGCPSSFFVNVMPGNTAAQVEWVEPIASDNSGTVFTTSTHSPPTVLPPGSTTIIYTFTDPAGNQQTCRFIVTVIRKHGLSFLLFITHVMVLISMYKTTNIFPCIIQSGPNIDPCGTP